MRRIGGSAATLPAAIGWRVDPDFSTLLRPNNTFEATGAGAERITGFVLGRVFVGACDYSLTLMPQGYRLDDGRRTPGGADDPASPAAQGRAEILSAAESGRGRPVTVDVAGRTGRNGRLEICGRTAGACQSLASTRSEIVSVRYLMAPDTLSGTLGVVQKAPGGGRWLINVDVAAAGLR